MQNLWRESKVQDEAAAVAFRMWKWLWKRQMIVFSKTAFAGRGSRGWFVFTADPLPSQMQVDFISTKPRFYSSTIFSENKKNEWTIVFWQNPKECWNITATPDCIRFLLCVCESEKCDLMIYCKASLYSLISNMCKVPSYARQIISLIRSTYLSSYGGLSIYVLWEKQSETYLI